MTTSTGCLTRWVEQLHSSIGAVRCSGDTTNAIANARLDSLYTRGYRPVQFGVERSVLVSDHFPVWLDVAWLPP